MKSKYWLVISSILMILIGLVRAVGGIALLTKGNQLDTDLPIIASNSQISMVAIGLLLIGVLFILAAIRLVSTYSKHSWKLSWMVMLLFLLGGLLNGYLLFGQPLDKGQIINFGVVILVGLFLLLGRSAIKSES